MPTQTVAIPEGGFIDLHTVAALRNRKKYAIQNAGNNTVLVGESETAPTDLEAQSGHPIAPRKDFELTADDGQHCYAWTGEAGAGGSRLVISEAN
ncbi:MAG: hypothetical protein OXC91_14475 [Rhodobacteraceae bacterium]|nr:hypothetical protein [Paracoccaceae bacterium]